MDGKMGATAQSETGGDSFERASCNSCVGLVFGVVNNNCKIISNFLTFVIRQNCGNNCG